MPQEDFIKRQIDQLGRVLGKILSDLLGLKTQGRINEGIEMVDQTLKKALDLNIDNLSAIPTDKFIETLQSNNKLSNDNIEMLADIIFLLADEADYRKKVNEKRRKLYEKSLVIYEYLDKTSSTYSFDRHLKMDKIKYAL